jgi:hypothetical protein
MLRKHIFGKMQVLSKDFERFKNIFPPPQHLFLITLDIFIKLVLKRVVNTCIFFIFFI